MKEEEGVMHYSIYQYGGVTPKIADDVFIASGTSIIGDVVIANNSNIWFNCVIRGDVAHIKIGERTNIQDGTIIHVTKDYHPTHIGSGVTIGHKALIHACTLEDDCFVGMGSIILDDAVVESGGMLGAGSLLTSKKVVKSGELWMGSPAKYMRDLTDVEKEHIFISSDNYCKLAKQYCNQ